MKYIGLLSNTTCLSFFLLSWLCKGDIPLSSNLAPLGYLAAYELWSSYFLTVGIAGYTSLVLASCCGKTRYWLIYLLALASPTYLLIAFSHYTFYGYLDILPVVLCLWALQCWSKGLGVTESGLISRTNYPK